MFTLRRAAARAVFAQPIRQLSTLRPASRVSPFQIEKPVLSRSLHQSWKLLAEETKSSTEEAEATGENASETVQEKAEETAQEAKSTISNVVEQAQNAASSAAETVQDAMSSVMTPGSQDGAGSAATHNNKILYIGNLFFEVTPAQLEAEFSQFGRITNTTIVSDNRGMSKGFAYIEFADTSSAERAVREKSQVVFQGRRMAVQFHVPRQARTNQKNESANPPSKTLFIGNMSYQMTDGDLNDLFKDIRNVLDVRVAIDRRSGQPRGFAHADFVDAASAVEAKTVLENKVIYGRALRIDYSASGQKASNTGPAKVDF